MKLRVEVPESLSQITLEQYQRFFKIQMNNDDERFLQVKMVEIFCEVPADKVLNMKLSDVNAICNMLNDLFDEKPELVRKTKIGEKEYGFVPNLEDISLGEYIDLDTNIGDWENMHLTMNVLYRPIKHKYGERYSIEDYKAGDGIHMKDITMDCVLSSLLFFYNLGIELSQTILNYLKEKEESNLVQYLSSQPNGVGINQFTHSLMETLQELRISLN